MDNRSKILACALELFAARGYDAVGVQEIVEAAGVTKPTLYHYYGSKLGLLKALLETHQAPFKQDLYKTATYTGDLPLTLENLARLFFAFARQDPLYYRLYLASNFAPRDSEAQRVFAQVNQTIQSALEDLFTSAVKDHGNMRGRQRLYAATLLGLFNACIGLWLNGSLELDEALVRSVIHQFQHGIYS